MKHLNLTPRRALRRGALGLGVVTASLAMASAASAAVITVTPDTAGSDHLTAAINTANTNGSTSNTIILTPGRYLPLAQPITITKNLTITGDHSVQASGGSPAYNVDGTTAQTKNPAADFLVINPGVNVTLEGITIESAGAQNQTGVVDNGNLTTWGVALQAGNGHGLSLPTAGAAATLNETSVVSNLQDQILNSGSLTLNSSSVLSGGGNGIDALSGSATLRLNDSVLAGQVGPECNGGTGSSNGGPGSADDDGTCNVQYPSDPGLLALTSQNYTPHTNGGPTPTVDQADVADLAGKGVNCPTVDQRFFANPQSGGATHCDPGAYTNGATQETTAPACVSTAILAGPPKQQQVTLSDGGSGIGPNPGPATDNASNTPPTSNPGAASPLAGYGVDNLWINNGTVSFTSPLAPTNNGVVLTATKTTAGQGTQWNFTGTNWAGVPKFCN